MFNIEIFTVKIYIYICNDSDTFNENISQILANTTGPELQVRGDAPDLKIGTLKYQYNVATLVGDNCFHATNSVDYHGEMRMAATIFLADVGEDNISAIMDKYVTYPKHYPPPAQPELLLQQARKHWDRDNPSSKLPTTTAAAAGGESFLVANEEEDQKER